jgi:hypothetical protein
MEQDQADALMVSEEAKHVTNRATIVELAAKNPIFTMYPYREFVEIGGLTAYSINLADIYIAALPTLSTRSLEARVRETSRFTNRPNSS